MAAVAPIRQQVQLCIGKAGLPVGSLVYVRQGRRENCAFAYDEAWLSNSSRFNVSADLQLVPGHQPHKAASTHDSVCKTACKTFQVSGVIGIQFFPPRVV